ncbi:hypothetical protein GCM10009639_11930 [Kitasatospora putterlickiae]|uniref:Uncharacterized protein n=1 Tax=Kitasatospora putterlickiae TaxID=221725 RepID=A0ABN1XPX9_9ACTN
MDPGINRTRRPAGERSTGGASSSVRRWSAEVGVLMVTGHPRHPGCEWSCGRFVRLFERVDGISPVYANAAGRERPPSGHRSTVKPSPAIGGREGPIINVEYTIQS